MTEVNQTLCAIQQTRRRAIIVPREHGAWGLLLVPLFTGLVTGFAPERRAGASLLFTVAALSLFALRTPLESLLGIGTIRARTPSERWTALAASTCFGMLPLVCLTVLMWNGRYSDLLILGGASTSAFVLQAILRKRGRSTRMLSQMVGAIGLTCTAPAAYYIGTGRLDTRAFVLWAANWIFAGNQIHFVQLRIHAAQATTFKQKLARGKFFLVAHPVLLMVLILASRLQILPSFSIVAFIPAVIRGSQWFLQKSEPLDVKRLGWSEMKQGVAFGLLLACALWSSRPGE
jgi:hypothetical protein